MSASNIGYRPNVQSGGSAAPAGAVARRERTEAAAQTRIAEEQRQRAPLPSLPSRAGSTGGPGGVDVFA